MTSWVVRVSSEVYRFAPVIPAGTVQAAGWSQDLPMPPRLIDGIDLKVPPGPRGNMGFRLGSAGTPIVPVNGGWIVTDDETIHLDLQGQINSGAWTFYGYNLGVKDHVVNVAFRCSLLTAKAGPPGLTFIQNPSLTFGSV